MLLCRFLSFGIYGPQLVYKKNPFLSKRVYKAALWGVKTGYEDDKKTMLGKHVFNPGAAPYIRMIGMIIVFFSGCNR